MRRGFAFWPIILILIGIAWLLSNLGYVAFGVVVGPLILIALGAWVLWGALTRPQHMEAQQVSVPLEGATSADVRMRHGAGRLEIGAGAAASDLLTGTFGGGLDYRVNRSAGRADVDMRVPYGAFPFVFPWTWGRGGFDWSIQFNKDVALSLRCEMGAGESRLDLSDLRVTDLDLRTGASATTVTLPAHAGHVKVHIEAGAASVSIRIPQGVSARLRAGGGLAGVTVDRSRFPREGGVYISPDFGTAENTVDIDAQVGVGSVDMR
jgi:hypothetical protein